MSTARTFVFGVSFLTAAFGAALFEAGVSPVVFHLPVSFPVLVGAAVFTAAAAILGK